ncbi:MAG: hydrogenase iron-sulfur subunit [Candidatus Lokiarchaeota archaeon]|nr:hydrogenase iron-sulfur subunit [Candidatus Lokiarchaeota archaeon]
MVNFEPRILGFLCNWCSYAGADLAGVSRIQYPPNMRVIRVMCSGRVDPKFIFEGLLQGLDGIFIMGCHIGDCHYLEGNYEAEKKFHMVKKFLEFIGMQNRVRLDWVSASEGARFGELVLEFVNHIKSLGPSPLSGVDKDKSLEFKLKAIERAAGTSRIRALVGRERKITEFENVYGEKYPMDKFEGLFNEAIRDEFIRASILLFLEKEPQSIKNLALQLNIDSSEVLENIVVLKGRAQVDMSEIEGISPIYIRT